MKKLFVLSCVALATLASCSKSEDIEAPQAQKEIAFSVATDKSRAPIENATFPETLSMYVSAYNSVSGKYFKGVEFAKSGDVWKGKQYWPINGVTSFLAYAVNPFTDDAKAVVGTATWGQDKYADKVVFNIANGFYNPETTTVGEQTVSVMTPYVDLLYASGEQAKEKDYTKVPMTFKHTGAWVVFNVKLAENLSNAKVTLKKFQLAQIFNKGTLTIDNTIYPGAKASWAFTPSNEQSNPNPADYDVQSFTAKDLSTTDYTFGAIIPEQNQTAIKFEYTLTSTNQAFDAQTATYTYPLSNFGKWEMGKKYVYNITINFKEIEIEPEVEKWVDTTDTPIGI